MKASADFGGTERRMTWLQLLPKYLSPKPPCPLAGAFFPVVTTEFGHFGAALDHPKTPAAPMGER